MVHIVTTVPSGLSRSSTSRSHDAIETISWRMKQDIRSFCLLLSGLLLNSIIDVRVPVHGPGPGKSKSSSSSSSLWVGSSPYSPAECGLISGLPYFLISGSTSFLSSNNSPTGPPLVWPEKLSSVMACDFDNQIYEVSYHDTVTQKWRGGRCNG